jgi:hypothetical protein
MLRGTYPANGRWPANRNPEVSMTAGRHRVCPDHPPPGTGAPAPRRDKTPPPDRLKPSELKPSEPFEECGPAGGYGGAGVDDDDHG